MSKDYLAINAGRVILTKVDPMTGALSTKPEDKRICTETVDGITRSKAMESYEIADGNSNYPAGSYEMGVTYNVGVSFTTLNSATLAFLQNAKITSSAGIMKEFVETMIPMEAPYELEALGAVSGTPNILDSESKAFVKTSSTPEPGSFKVEDGVAGVRQSMKRVVTSATSSAGKAELTILAAGSSALKDGKVIDVNLTESSESVNASEIRSVLKADKDVSAYFVVGGEGAEVVLTKRIAEESESVDFDFDLDTAVGTVLGAVTHVVGVVGEEGKFVFAEADAGKAVFLEYNFEADEIEAYDVNENHINPVVHIEIIHETLSKDKTKRYKNNSTVSRAVLTGNIDENLAKQHGPTVLNFAAIKPAGANVVMNKKAEIAL